MYFSLYKHVHVKYAMPRSLNVIVNCSYDVPILIICLLRYSSLSLLPSLSLPLSHVSVAMTVVLLTGWYSNCYLLNVNEVLLLC